MICTKCGCDIGVGGTHACPAVEGGLAEQHWERAYNELAGQCRELENLCATRAKTEVALRERIGKLWAENERLMQSNNELANACDLDKLKQQGDSP